MIRGLPAPASTDDVKGDYERFKASGDDHAAECGERLDHRPVERYLRQHHSSNGCTFQPP
ncbi:hypothetical protein AB3480_29340 [Rhizobium mongolense]|uniref:hypothetical protein n=1 Tax=Rhizobium mongolense TaxID=57676 RepID=UPI0034A5AAD8